MAKSRLKIIVGITVSVLSASLLAATPASAWSDPAIAVSVFGGTSGETVKSIAFDSSGNIYTAGIFSGTADFDPGVGSETLTSSGSIDVFISKLDASGNFLWAKSFGGSSGEYAYSIAVDSNGDLLIGGSFASTVDFDPGAGVASLTSVGQSDAYISKLDASGNFLWVKSFGGTAGDELFSIAVDTNRNVYGIGYFRSTVDFDPSAAVANVTSAGNSDISLWKLDSSGEFVWAKTIGGSLNEYANDIAVDGSGNILITGNFFTTLDFDPGAGVTDLISAGGNDAFVIKLDSSGNLIWAKNLGGISSDAGSSIAVDSDGNVYSVGTFNETADFDPGSGVLNLTAARWNDVFISKLNSSGNLVWGKSFGGTAYDYANAVAVDNVGNVFITGNFSETVDFDPGAGVTNLSSINSAGAYISKLDSLGNFMWASSYGGSSNDEGTAVGVDSRGFIYSAGNFRDIVDFDPGSGVANLTSAGSSDVFILRFNSSGDASSASLASSPSSSTITTDPAAAAAAAQRQVEICEARAELVRKTIIKEELSLQLFAKADIPGLTSENIGSAQAEIFALPDTSRSEISHIIKVVRKYEVVGMISSDRVNRVYSNLYIEIGLISAESKNKTALVNAVKRLDAIERNTFEAIKVAIAAEQAAITKRSEHLALVLSRNSSR